jgi:hypothetical protein
MNPYYSVTRGRVSFRTAIEALEDIKILLLPPGIETRFLGIQPVTQSLYSIHENLDLAAGLPHILRG